MHTIIIISLLIILATLSLWFLFPAFTSNRLINAKIRSLGLQHHRALIGDTDFHWLESSGKGPAIVMIHGFNGDATNWMMMAPDLKKYRLIMLDIPPFGSSQLKHISHKADNFTIAAQAQRVDNFVQYLSLARFYLAGNSMGGYIAGTYTSEFPEKVLGQILLSPALVKSAPYPDHFQAELDAGKNPLILDTQAEFERVFKLCFYKPPYLPAPLKRSMLKRLLAIRIDTDTIVEIMTNQTTALEDILADCQIPTLIIWGKDDKILNPAGAEILQKQMKQAELQMPKQTGHVPMMEHPHATAQSIDLFISRQEN